MFSTFTPVTLVYTGLAYTGAIPADIASFPLPISGRSYDFGPTSYLSQLGGTGNVGSLSFTYVLFSQTGGLGVQLGVWTAVSSVTSGMSRASNFTVTGYTPLNTGVFLRVTNNDPSVTGTIIGLSVDMRLLS